MLCKLAWGNVRRAGRDYLVYLLTLTLAVTVFYAFNTISIQIDFVTMEEGLSNLLGSVISGLTVFLAMVMGFLMVYANNFIMKRRKKEFGLYQVLGMSRGQVSRVMALETAIVSGAALLLGIVLGIGFSQIMVFFTASLFKTQIADFHFFFSTQAFAITVGCLVAIFLVTLAFNLVVVRRAKVIDLMGAGRKNEAIKVRNPFISALLFIVGAVLIGVAYYRLLRDGLPIDAVGAEAEYRLNQFGVTTGIVVAGTILFFFGLSGFLLKALQGARGLYWRGLNMFTMRQLSAKVNTVSFSMAIISMILFLAITSVTGGMSIASVMNANIERCCPADYSRAVIYLGPDVVSNPERAYMYQQDPNVPLAVATDPIDVLEASAGNTDNPGLPDAKPYHLADILGEHVQVDWYSSTPFGGADPLVTLVDLCDAVGKPLPAGTNGSDASALGLAVMSESDYNRYLAFRSMSAIDLGTDGYLITCDMGETVGDIYNAVLKDGVKIEMAGHELAPAAQEVNDGASSFTNSMMGSNSGCLVVPDEVIAEANLMPYASYLLGNYKEGLSYEETEEYVEADRMWSNLLDGQGRQHAIWGLEATYASTVAGANSMNGLVSYLAIYIGFVLVVACAAILAIQQLSSVADSSKSCRILSELGTSKREIAGSILAQQAVFFIFPLVVGIAHSFVALHVVVELVELFGSMEIGFTVGSTCAIFLLCYGGYFVVTYLMSKGMVGDAIRSRHAA